MHPFTTYALGIAIVGVALYAAYEALSKYNAKYNPRGLPGPTLVPWFGRIHDLPIEFMWLKFDEWAKKYGPIYRTKMLGANFIIITDEKIAEDMLVKKAKIYSDRPEIKSLFDAKSTYGSMEYLPLMGKNRNLSFEAHFIPSANCCQNTGHVSGSLLMRTSPGQRTTATTVSWNMKQSDGWPG